MLSAILLAFAAVFASSAALYFFSGVPHYIPEGEALGLSGDFSYPEMGGDGSDMWVYFNMALLPDEDDCQINIYLDSDGENVLYIGTDSLGIGNDGLDHDFGAGAESFNNVVIRIIRQNKYYDVRIFVNEEAVYMGTAENAELILSRSFAGEVIGGAAVIDDYHLYRNDDTYTEISTDFDHLVGYGYLQLLNLPGDADGDGYVTASDVVLMRRYFAGIAPFVRNLKAADFDRDGVLNSKDLLQLRRSLAE